MAEDTAWYRHLEPWKLYSLRNGGNAGLIEREDGVLVLLADDAHGDAKRIISSLTGVKLIWLLRCGRHRRRCTSHNISGEDDLDCRYCMSDDELTAAGKNHPSSHKRMFWEFMVREQVDQQLWPESHIEGWGGLIDFIDYVTWVLLQVDGEHHFAGKMYGESCMKRLDDDKRMCLAAWNARHVLVRLHYMDVANASGMQLAVRIMDAVAKGRCGPLLVFSKSYDTRGTQVSDERSLVGAVAKELRDRAEVVHLKHSILIAPKSTDGAGSP